MNEKKGLKLQFYEFSKLRDKKKKKMGIKIFYTSICSQDRQEGACPKIVIPSQQKSLFITVRSMEAKPTIVPQKYEKTVLKIV